MVSLAITFLPAYRQAGCNFHLYGCELEKIFQYIPDIFQNFLQALAYKSESFVTKVMAREIIE